jgi:hypothetical protein
MIRISSYGFLFFVFFIYLTCAADKRRDEIKSAVSSSTNVLTFNSFSTFKKLVTKGDRDYDIFVMLTASKNVGCAVCQDWEDAFIEVAQAYKAQLNGREEKMFFSIAKYDTLPDVFRLYSLNHAPLIVSIPHDLKETTKITPKLSMNLANMESAFPDPIATFVSQSGHKVEIIYSPWPKIMALSVFLVFSLVAGRKVALIFVPILRRYKWLWLILSLVLYGLGVSGSIYSFLRNVPNYGIDQKTKNVIYFAGDRAQFFYEGIIIWAILLGGATCLVFSAYGVIPLPQSAKPIRPFLSLAALGIFGFLFKFYVTLYMGKAQWYRYGMVNSLTWPWVA